MEVTVLCCSQIAVQCMGKMAHPSGVLDKGKPSPFARGVPRAGKGNLGASVLPFPGHVVVCQGPRRGLDCQVQLFAGCLLLLQQGCAKA